MDAMLARAAEEEEEERRSQSPKRDELPKRKPLSTSERMVEEAMAARTRSLSTSVSPKRDGSPTRKAEATAADHISPRNATHAPSLSTSERMVEEAMAARTRSPSKSVSPKRDGSPTRKAEATTADRRVDEMMARAKARQVARR